MLKDKVAVVTGGTRGIGKAIALKLAQSGASIVLNYRTKNEELDRLIEELEENSVRVLPVKGDVSNAEEAKLLIDEAYNTFGKVDVLVNNAGITKDDLLIRMKEEDFDRVIDVNLKGTFNTMKVASKYMIKQRSGRIINISSVVGITGNAGQGNYAASKAGVIALTKSAAKELGVRGITVNAVAPGFIMTDMTEVLPDKIKEEMKKNIPLSRFGSGEEVADLVCFLSSDSSAYITGQVINIDGGMVM